MRLPVCFHLRSLGLLLALGVSVAARAQQGVGIGTTTPNPQAALDIQSSSKGLLIPRLDSAQRVAIGHPANGLLVFQKDGRRGLWYAFGGGWSFIPDQARAADNLGNHLATQPLRLNGQSLTNNGTGGLRLDNAGQVGIGTAAPAAPLHVSGSAAVNNNLATVGLLQASSAPRPYSPNAVADGDVGTTWQSVATNQEQWLQIDFGTQPRSIAEYRVALPATFNTRRGWVLQCSQDALNWTSLHTVAAGTPPVGGWGQYPVSLLGSYRYYRLLFPAPLPAQIPAQPVAVAEWELRTTPDVPSSLAVRVAPGALQLETGTAVRAFSPDGTLATATDDAVPTQQAVKTYVAAHGADNLGNHLATQDLNLGTHRLVGNGGTTGLTVTGSGDVQAATLSGLGTRPVQADATGTLVAAPPIYTAATPTPYLGTLGAPATALLNGTQAIAIDGPNGTTACVVGYLGMQVFDVTNPAQPQLRSTVSSGSRLTAVAMNGSYAYVTRTTGHLLVYDLSNPAAPQLLSTTATAAGANPYEISVSGGRAYVALSTNYIQLFDLSNPAVPQSIGLAATPSDLLSVAASGTRFCTGSYYSATLQTYNLIGTGVFSQGSIVTAGQPADIVMAGTLAYVTCRLGTSNVTADKLQVFDLTNVAQPLLLATADLPVGEHHIALSGSRLAVTTFGANNVYFLNLFDVGTPTQPRLLGSMPVPGVIDVAANATAAYALTNSGFNLQAFTYYAPQVVSALPDGSLTSAPLASLYDVPQDLALNDHDLRLRQLTNPGYGLGYYGTGKPWNTQMPDGPVLYGTGGGVLGATPTGVRTSVLTWTGTGRVGIGTALPLSALHVVGSLRVTNLPFGDYQNVQWDNVTGQFYYDNSSRRYKVKVRPLHADFGALLDLTPVTYERAHTPGRRELGFIAEQADSLGLRPLVEYDSLGRPDGFNYEKAITYVVGILRQERAARRSLEAELRAEQRRRQALQLTVETGAAALESLEQRLRRLEAPATGQAQRQPPSRAAPAACETMFPASGRRLHRSTGFSL